MRLIFIILIGIMWIAPAYAADCQNGETIVVTNPRDGARTFNDGITVRGFLCENFEIIEISNETTHKTATTLTTEVCDKGECTYHFAVPMRDLAMGSNEIKAKIPGEDIEVEVELIRTAWVGL